MRSFLKMFFASLLAVIVFGIISVFFIVAFVGGLASKEIPKVSNQSVLVINLSQHFAEQEQRNALSMLGTNKDIPGLFDVLSAIRAAKSDKRIEGIYLIADGNANGFAASEELRASLLDFKSGGKFIIAHGDMMTQKAYAVAQIADRVYVNPQGNFEWTGMSVEYTFLKGTLEKLDIEPQIFYAGKFKSATEPFRAEQMTPENRLQTSVWLNDIYNNLLLSTAEVRKIDTAILHYLANEALIQTPADAVANGLIDATKYDDEVKDEIKTKLKLGKYDRINFVNLNTYGQLNSMMPIKGDKIAVIFAEGNIVDGTASRGNIGGDDYRKLIRKARLDRNVKAIVFRVNSGGGSALASEIILRELTLAKAEKPVVVSFGDVAASGGYYISCAADSIFALRSTITGSIGVFGIIPNMQSFFKNKLGVTFDGVKTGQYADAGAAYRPMTDPEKKMVQLEIERIYQTFKQRVADGRKKDTAYVDSIAQGRVWTGTRAIEIGLVDRFGGLQDAIASAARMAKLTDYYVAGYPETKDLFSELFGETDPMNYAGKIEQEIGVEQYRLFQEMKAVREMCGTIQARIPFQFYIH